MSAACFDVTIAGGADGRLTGAVETTDKGEAEKLEVDVTFNALREAFTDEALARTSHSRTSCAP